MGEMIQILQGDCSEHLRTLPDGCVQCCVTSPPYWGLRDYGVSGQIGLERTPEEYVAKMVEVFREVRRVLRDDGVLWLNLGDSYAAQRGGTTPPAETLAGGINGRGDDNSRRGRKDGYNASRNCSAIGLKHKDLVGIPWRVAFALQADGWYLRSDVIWSKPNPMPESVTDRPTKAHEYIFLLTKSERYFYDAEAIKEEAVAGFNGSTFTNGKTALNGERMGDRNDTGTRNKRTVWTVATSPYSEAHFATFPEDLIKPCILAGTSAKGCCPQCGAPWERVVEKEYKGSSGLDYKDQGSSRGMRSHASGPTWAKWKAEHPNKDLGWQPTCTCGLDTTTPCTVLDPFGGSGTTGQVALELGRKAILIELNPKYIDLINRRTHVTPGLQLA